MKLFFSVLAFVLLAGFVSASCPFNFFNPATWSCIGVQPFEAGGGADFLSCATTQITSSNPFYAEGLKTKCDAVVSGGGQSASFKVAGSNVCLTLDAPLSKQSCVYPITQDASVQVNSYAVINDWGSSGLARNAITESPQYALATIPYSAQAVTWTVHAKLFYCGNNTVIGEADLDKNHLTASMGSPRSAVVKWISDQGSIQMCSTSYHYLVRPVNGGYWSIADTGKVEGYKSVYWGFKSQFDAATPYQCTSNWGGNFKYCCYGQGSFGSYNPPCQPSGWSQASQLTSSVNGMSLGGSFSDSYAYSPSAPVVAPAVSVYLSDAFFESIIIPNVKPLILSAAFTAQPVANSPTPLSVSMTSLGEAGSIDFSLTCAVDAVTITANRMTVNPNQTTTGVIYVNGLEQEQDCILTASDVADPSNKDSKVVRVVIEAQPCPHACCQQSIYQDKSCLPSLTWLKSERSTTTSTFLGSNVCAPAVIDLGGNQTRFVSCRVLDGQNVADSWVTSSLSVTSLFACETFNCVVTKTCAGSTCQGSDPVYVGVIEGSEIPYPTTQPPISFPPTDYTFYYAAGAALALGALGYYWFIKK